VLKKVAGSKPFDRSSIRDSTVHSNSHPLWKAAVENR